MATGIPRGTTAEYRGPGGSGGTGMRSRPGPAGGWTAGRVVTLIIGSVLALISLGFLGGGGTLLWAGQALRHDGFVTTSTSAYSTSGYALASDRVSLHWGLLLTGLVGDVRVRVTAVSSGKPVFVAIGPADQVAAYLSGTPYATVTGTRASGIAVHDGAGRPAPPLTAGIWAAQVTGAGPQVLRWTAQDGDWTVVAMNQDGSAGVAVRADAGVSAPGLLRLALKLVAGGITLGALSAALIWVPVRLAAGAG
jgi:hypothetical protein